jgi:hypothetical protein
MGSNWGCYPPSEVAKNDRPSALPIGIYFTHATKSINILFTKLHSHNSNYTQHNLGPSLRASISVDLISIASTEKQKWLYTMKWKG